MDGGKITVGLAWRNVWRNKRRTILTLLTIFAGCAMIILMNAFAKGGHEQMIEDAVGQNTGHIQIHEKGYWEDRTIDYAFTPDDAILKALDGDDRIHAWTIRVQADGLLSLGNSTAGAMIQGVDPATEPRVTTLHNMVLRSGRYLQPGDRKSIVIGEILAKNLGAGVGSSIALISQGFDGSIAAERLTVVGLIRSGNPEYDRGLVIMPLAQAMETFSMMGFVHSITVRLKSVDDMELVCRDLQKLDGGSKLEFMGWDDLMPELVQFIVMDDISGYIFDVILFLVVAFGILNTIQMSVFERTRELGVMLALGTTPRQVVSMVLIESFFISLLGIALGLAAGAALSYYYKVNPMDVSDYANEMAVWGVSTTIFPAHATALNLTVTAVVTLALALLFSIFPARRAARLNPITAIRHL